MANNVPSEEKSPSVSALFSAPFEDTSGLDVFAQIAASIPLESTNSAGMLQRRHSSADIVHQSQSQLAQSIYQSQQALRQQQQLRRASVTTTGSNASSSYSDFDDEDEEFEAQFDKYDASERAKKVSNNHSNFSSTSLLPQTIEEESESELAMDIDSPAPSEPANLESSSIQAQRRASLPANAFSSYEPANSSLSSRRIVHNICERKRRENIREGFERLQARLPASDAENSRLSKMEILQGAYEVIEGLRERIKSLNEEVSALQVMSEQ